MLFISPVLVRPSIDVPRTMLIGLTDTALDSPIRRAAVPCAPSTAAVVSATAVVVVIAVMVAVPISRGRDHASATNCADDAQRRGDFLYGSHDCLRFPEGTTRNLEWKLHEWNLNVVSESSGTNFAYRDFRCDGRCVFLLKFAALAH